MRRLSALFLPHLAASCPPLKWEALRAISKTPYVVSKPVEGEGEDVCRVILPPLTCNEMTRSVS